MSHQSPRVGIAEYRQAMKKFPSMLGHRPRKRQNESSWLAPVGWLVLAVVVAGGAVGMAYNRGPFPDRHAENDAIHRAGTAVTSGVTSEEPLAEATLPDAMADIDGEADRADSMNTADSGPRRTAPLALAQRGGAPRRSLADLLDDVSPASESTSETRIEVRAALKNYKLIYDLDLAKLGRPVRYDVDESTRFVGEFDRIAYWLELQKPGEEIKFVCVSMDAFTDDATKIGVPTTGSQAAFQTNVAKLNVLSNVEGIKQGQGLPGGNIEFWPNKYAPLNGANIPGASGESFDFGDRKGPLENGYGCMQVHNHAAGHTIFAINNWNAGAKVDIGIGNSPGQHRDWTLASNGEQYQSKRLRILVRPTGKPGKPKEPGWERSYASGKTDVNGQFLGGSEIFHIESHKGKLFAATSYWMDENNTYYSNGKRNQWAQVLVKDSKNSPWREDYDTGDDRGVLRPEILQSVTFTKPNPDVNLLFLATYRKDHSKYYVDIMVRNDSTGKWIKTTPHSGPKLPDDHDFSVRAMRVYTDRVTREERIFVTVGIQGVLSGVYDPKVPGWIRWYPLHPVKFSERALSICEANNSLVIGAGDAVWRRKDGRSPSYSIVHDLRDLVDRPVDPAIGGIRGMTTIDNPNGPGDSLLFLWSNADAKGACGSMYRLDPDGRGGYNRHEDVRLASVVQEELGVYPSFILGSYSYVQPVRNPVTRHINHLVGLYVQLQHGKHSYPTWYEQKKIYMGGLFAIRDEKGRYTINEVNGRHNGSGTPLTAVRAIEPSPFRNDTDVYFGGHDCATKMSTDFAWMYKAPLRTVLRLPPARSSEVTVAQPRTSPSDQAPAQRKWTSGNYSTQARLVTFADGIAVLKKSDGKIVRVPYVVLSPADQQYLDDWKKRK